MTSSPSFSAPVLYTPSDLKSNPALVTQITDLINDAFTRSKMPDPVKWRQGVRRRFPSDDLYFEMLGSDGVAAVILDETTEDRKVVAVAAAVPWQGGWNKEGAGVEEGWEIKAVAVDGEAKYLKRGLAVQLYTFLEQHLASKTKKSGVSTTGRKLNRTDQLTLWILAAECIAGAYWRKRGYTLVRKDIAEAPTWGCLTTFEMVVLRKDVPLTLPDSELPINGERQVEESARCEVQVN